MLETINKLENLKKEVTNWSMDNFGHNGLWEKNYLAPLLGIVEEFGELSSSTDEEGVKDSLADICIYCMDFAGRKKIDLTTLDIPKISIQEDAVPTTILILLGDMSHHILKEIQGIRGYDNSSFAKEKINQTFSEILALVNYICEYEFNQTMADIAQETWDKIVSKRNWKKDAQ